MSKEEFTIGNEVDFDSVFKFNFIEKNYQRCFNYQQKKYKFQSLTDFEIAEDLCKWNEVYSDDENVFAYLPPAPSIARKILITRNAKTSFFGEGMYAQLIQYYENPSKNIHHFKLYHNHSSPFEDGLIPATLTILDQEKGIAKWEEWRRKDSPLIAYLINNSQLRNVTLLKNKPNVKGDLSSRFNNEWLKKMDSDKS